MSAKHTPGLWEVEDPMGPDTLSIVQADRLPHTWVIIASVHSDDPDESGPRISQIEMEANARLIAAAPDLLDALERVEWWLSTVPQGAAMRDVCRAAITKATTA